MGYPHFQEKTKSGQVGKSTQRLILYWPINRIVYTSEHLSPSHLNILGLSRSNPWAEHYRQLAGRENKTEK